MKWIRRLAGKEDPEPIPELIPAGTHPSSSYGPLPDLPNYDPEPADGMRVGHSVVPGPTLKRILRGHHQPYRLVTGRTFPGLSV